MTVDDLVQGGFERRPELGDGAVIVVNWRRRLRESARGDGKRAKCGLEVSTMGHDCRRFTGMGRAASGERGRPKERMDCLANIAQFGQ